MPASASTRPRLDELEAFLAVAERQSFSVAAQDLRLTKATVSKRVGALERRVGVRLFHRTTRSVRLSEAGESFRTRCSHVLDELEDAESQLGALAGQFLGRLRVSAPVSLGQAYLARVVASFVKTHPRVEVDFSLEDRMVDVVAERYDLAIRVGALRDSALGARKLRESRFLVVASPAYLKAHGTPREPSALVSHDCLLYSYQSALDTWTFHGAKPLAVRVRGRYRSNHGDVLAQAAVEGLGLALLPDFIARPYLDAGKLRVVLDAHCRATAPIHAVFPSLGARAAKVEAFVDAVAAALGA